MTECIPNHQTNNHFAHNQKRLKDLLKTIWVEIDAQVISNDTF